VKAPLLLLALLAAAPPARAELELPESITIRAGRLGKLDARGAATVIRWVNVHEEVDLIASESGRWCVLACTSPGRYRLAAYTADAAGPSEPVYCLLVVQGEAPAPPAPPTPPSPPAPPATLGKAWLVVIEETAQAAAGRGAFLADPSLVAYLQAKGWRQRLADKDAVDASGACPADLCGYLAAAKGKKLPYLFVVDEHGHARYQGEVPATPAALLALLTKIGGAP
jgi:hypothetical protein